MGDDDNFAMRWDLFCRVIDNYGDVGVAWRLARDLDSRGEQVRLWLDDASALAWMAPNRAGVQVLPWDSVPETIGDVVVELFGQAASPLQAGIRLCGARAVHRQGRNRFGVSGCALRRQRPIRCRKATVVPAQL